MIEDLKPELHTQLQGDKAASNTQQHRFEPNSKKLPAKVQTLIQQLNYFKLISESHLNRV